MDCTVPVSAMEKFGLERNHLPGCHRWNRPGIVRGGDGGRCGPYAENLAYYSAASDTNLFCVTGAVLALCTN